jgi:hypothetical protein
MGHSPAGLARLRAMAERFFDSTYTVLEPVKSAGEFSDDAIASYAGTTHAGKYTSGTKKPESGDYSDPLDRAMKIADGEFSFAHTVSVSTQAIIIAANGTWGGPFNIGTSYTTGALVSFANKYWLALRNSTGVQPVAGADWSQVQDYQVVGVNSDQSNKIRTICKVKKIDG